MRPTVEPRCFWGILVVAMAGLAATGSRADADIVHADDVIIQGSLCVGLDCINNENFGFDTIRLKENNTRIKFEDTSVGAFPSVDWQLTANDSASGGQNKFSIDDITNSRVPFTVEAAAPTNSLYVDSTGRIGFRTATPSLDLHVVTGNTPAMRLEQNATSGFTAQTWDVGANEANFFVRDVTSGSRLIFRLFPGAPSNSLIVSPSGNVGIGLVSPAAPVHARKAAEANTAETLAQFDVSDDATGKLVINNASTSNAILHPRVQGTTASQATALTFEGTITDDVGINPVISLTASKAAGGAIATRPLVSFRNNVSVVAQLNANGDLTATSFNPSSSRTIKNDIVELESGKAAETIRQLSPVEFTYKSDTSGEKRVGFIAEDVPEIVATGDRASVPIMDVLAVVTKVVKDQQQTIEDQQKKIEELTRRLNAIEGNRDR